MGKSHEQIEYLDFVKELLEAGKLIAVIDRTYPFEQIPEAHTYFETGRKKESVVTTVDHN
ncbi:MAG: zinc-binding dehydrogenase [Candidatus Thorarchaeota archaeon]|nr:MAG: zinc-binding dehydrogenase [Candidatus Thorarchaeota archaeon]